MQASDLKSALSRYAWKRAPALWLGYRIAFRHRQFEPEHRLIPILCRSDMLAIDIGANMGEYAYYMAKHSKGVIAFEPNVDLWPHLRRLLGNAVRLEQAALSDRMGTTTFRYLDDNTGIATIETANALGMVEGRSRIRTREIVVTTLDSFHLESVSFIKIDVEGHEESVLDGASETLARNEPILLIESEDRHNAGAPARIHAKLSGRGYRGFYVKEAMLCNIESIRAEDQDPANLAIQGKAYINNYIYLPKRSLGLIPSLRARLGESSRT